MDNKPLYSPRVIRDLMEQHKLHFKKSLGQNFLTDINVLQKIVNAAELDDKSTVIEIGPGIGTLTQQLAANAGQVIAVELDQRFLPILHANFHNHQHVSIIHGDALKIDFLQLIKDEANNDKIHVVANLPYYVTTPIIMKLLESKLPLTNIVVMIQKEVAERIQAVPGTKSYGALSIAAQYYAKAQIVTIVPKNSFVPAPNVDSAVIKLSIFEKPSVEVHNEQLFFQVIKAAFASRRKTLWNNFKMFDQRINVKDLTEIFEKACIDEQRRGETLTIGEYSKLSNVINDFYLKNS